MAKAWIRDRWLKSKAVVDGVELTPTTGMKRQVAANPDTADVPAALRTADYGRGMRWQAAPREPAHPRGRRGARRRTQR